MIKDTISLTMAESLELMKKSESETSEIEGFISKFSKITAEKARELRKILVGLEIMQIKEEHIVKIIDLMPETEDDLNKIFIGVGLAEDDTKKILETIKPFKK